MALRTAKTGKERRQTVLGLHRLPRMQRSCCDLTDRQERNPMLDTDTKRRIDTARDILVGKVPDPKSQVEQITIALIYKFMDDMDAEAEELGGKRKFFTGEYARYGWAKLMRPAWAATRCSTSTARPSPRCPKTPASRRSSATSSRTPTCPTATRKRSRLPQDHRRVQLRPQRAPRRRLRIPALRPRQPGRRRPVPHPAPHHRLHGRGPRPQENDHPRPRLRHRRLPHLRLQAHPPRQHRRSQDPSDPSDQRNPSRPTSAAASPSTSRATTSRPTWCASRW
jgi:hypothetical protein